MCVCIYVLYVFYMFNTVSSCYTDLVGPVALKWGGATVQLGLAAGLLVQCKPGNQAVRSSALRENITQPWGASIGVYTPWPTPRRTLWLAE